MNELKIGGILSILVIVLLVTSGFAVVTQGIRGNDSLKTVAPMATSTYGVTFSETGLPSGSIWYINLTNGQFFSLSGSSITFYEPNGTYDYTIATNNKLYAPYPSSGTFTVNGNSVSIQVIFKLVLYAITFTETGLPAGTNWSVTLGNITKSSTTNKIVFNETNGSYSFTVKQISGYTSKPSSGIINVSGGNITKAVTFVPNGLYSVTFTENGLPSGTTWYINITNVESLTLTGSSITISLYNGSYNFTIASADKRYAPSPSSGSFTVNGANVNILITFHLVTYTVKFIENSLPTGTVWFVNLSNGQSFKGNLTSITFNEPNGSYSFTIATVDKRYAPSPYSGSFTVNGANVSVTINFYLVTFKITFTESGLPSGTLWFVNLSNGQSFKGNLTSITFSEPNG
ncbi:MAG: hypothetical protein ACP5UG_03565, partial [Thermoplasmata archaeon]